VGAELAVKDITAVLQFLALPEDDLSLACALRSPLFGWTEEELYQLAHHRTDKYLWSALRNGPYPATLAILDDLRSRTDFLRPYDLIERILTRHDGRRNLLSRLGQEAEDGIDALLSQALAYESSAVPSLTGFLTWMQGDDLEIKRQLDSQGDQIRVMTVHGSKGLEAPIVILPDCAKRKVEIREELLPNGQNVLWKTQAKNSPPAIVAVKEAMQAKQAAERLRLLYVAMTRAECWLIVAAAGEMDEDAWHSIVASGLSHLGIKDDFAGPLPIQRFSHLDWMPGEYVTLEKEDNVLSETITLEPIVKPSAVKPLSPSDLGGSKVLPGDPSDGDADKAMTRGSAIHQLLEHLPKQPTEDQQAYGEALLRSFPKIAGLDHETVREVRNLLVQPELAFVFANDTLAEVGIAGFVEALNSHILGTIDRLVVQPDRVIAIDFKSNRLVPDVPEQTPEGLLRQMGAYADALSQIYPDRRIETAILWTESGTLMSLPSSLVSSALARVSVP
jgi:ATP-dependent helicase/nuclease subunit A